MQLSLLSHNIKLHKCYLNILIIDYWKDASTIKYDIEDCRTFKIRVNF